MPSESDSVEIVVCLGSSCFARGNSENLANLKKFESHDGSAHIRLTGCLCQDKCRQSPNLTVGGEPQHDVTPEKLQEILERLTAVSGNPSLVTHGQA
jgi:NADH:ubiquinone oxidoreductase subunit E